MMFSIELHIIMNMILTQNEIERVSSESDIVPNMRTLVHMKTITENDSERRHVLHVLQI
jgi:hypothetical protein